MAVPALTDKAKRKLATATKIVDINLIFFMVVSPVKNFLPGMGTSPREQR
jgi:hypothetical protein